MKRWRVNAAVVGGAYLGEFEAETKEEAIEKAIADYDCGLCFHCSRVIEDAAIDADSAQAEEVE